MKNSSRRATVNRRDFIAMGAATGLIAPLCFQSTAAATPASAQSGFQTALQTYSLKELHLHYLLPAVRQLGFERVELYDRQLSPFSSSRDLANAIDEIEASGVSVIAFYSDEFANDELLTHSMFGFGAKLGVQTFSTGRPPEALAAADRLVPVYGIDVAIHNASPAPGSAYVTLEDVQDALRSLPNLTACVDVGNFFRAGVDPALAIRTLGARVREIHIKDADAHGRHTLLGEGEIDLEAMMEAIRHVGFRGLLTLEYGGQQNDIAGRMEKLAENARRLRELVEA